MPSRLRVLAIVPVLATAACLHPARVRQAATPADIPPGFDRVSTDAARANYQDPTGTGDWVNRAVLGCPSDGGRTAANTPFWCEGEAHQRWLPAYPSVGTSSKAPAPSPKKAAASSP